MQAGKAPDYYTRPISRRSATKRLQVLNYRIDCVSDGMIESSVYFTEHVPLVEFIKKFPSELPNLCHSIIEQLVEQLWLMENHFKRLYVLSVECIYISINGVIGLSPFGVLNNAGYHNASSWNLRTLREIIELLLVAVCPIGSRFDDKATYKDFFDSDQSQEFADFYELLLSPLPSISQLTHSRFVENKTTLESSVLMKIGELYEEIFRKWPLKTLEYACPHNLAAYHEEIEVVHLIKPLRVPVNN